VLESCKRRYRSRATRCSKVDVGILDAHGRLSVRGRLSEVIRSGGEKVWPSEVEGVLRRHPAIAEVAVAGRPDPLWGERVVAFVVPVAGGPPPLEELKELVSAEIAPWAAPKELHTVRALPRTAIGKVRRQELSAALANGTGPG
jgi:acyl-coenzyme A synthetase/AMP-(fatty) acid ligase